MASSREFVGHLDGLLGASAVDQPDESAQRLGPFVGPDVLLHRAQYREAGQLPGSAVVPVEARRPSSTIHVDDARKTMVRWNA